MTTIGSDLADLLNLGRNVSDGSGHLDISSESSGGHLDISSESSWGATPARAAQEAASAVEGAYKKAESSISAAYWKHEEFKDNYSSVKEMMTNSGSVDISRLGSLLGREEKQIRSIYGSTKWKSWNIDYGVDSYQSSRIQNGRDSMLSWIKSEQKSMGLPSKKSSFGRLSSWVSNAFSKKDGKSGVPEHLLDAIAEDDEAEEISDDERA